MTSASFGDNVRIRNVPQTSELGFAGLHGQVYGVTTPSVTGITAIGLCNEDVAINVHFAERGEGCWFAPELVELVDHNAGLEIGVGDKKWIRRADGGWDEISASSSKKRPWWKIWKT